jgi:hypothetical protein
MTKGMCRSLRFALGGSDRPEGAEWTRLLLFPALLSRPTEGTGDYSAQTDAITNICMSH